MTTITVLTPEKVAKLLQVTPRTLRDWRANKKGPNWIKMGGSIRYLEGAVNTYIESLTNE